MPTSDAPTGPTGPAATSRSARLDGEFADALCAFVAGEVSQIGEPIERDTDLLLSGAVDSLGVMRIVEWIERRLDTTIDPGDVVLEHFESVAAIVGYLEAR